MWAVDLSAPAKLLIAFCALCLLVNSSASGQEQGSKVEAALAAPFQGDFDSITLDETLAEFSKKTKTPIVLDRLGLEEAWIDPNSISVSYRSTGKSLAATLDEVLAASKLVWIQRHEAIVVTTAQAAAEYFSETKIYKLTRKAPPARRVESIRTSVAPESWKLAGGSGEIAPLPPSLIVITQSPVVHRQIITAFAQSLALAPNSKVESFGSPALNTAMQSPAQLLVAEKSASETLTQLAKKHRFEVEFDERSMKAAKIDLETLAIDFTVEESIALASLLSLVIELSHRELVWVPRGDKVFVTTKAAAAQLTETKTVDLKEIVSRVDPKYLVEAIEYNISPTTWEFGGGDGKLELSDEGKLTVTQCGPVHRELARFLDGLRLSVQVK